MYSHQADGSYSKAVTLKTCSLFKNITLIWRMLDDVDKWLFPEGEIFEVAQAKWMKLWYKLNM